MRSAVFTLLALFVSSTLLTAIAPLQVFAAGENLFLNPDVESGSTQPDNWAFGSWGGTVATTSYSATEGSTGKALNVIVTDAGTGDAKWYPNDVAVIPGSIYTFANSYKSNVDTNVIVRYTVGAETYAYDLLKVAPASSSWTTLTAQVSAPANATHVTIFHVISAVGELWIDNYSLTLNTPEPQEPTEPIEPTEPTEPPVVEEGNLVLNPSFESENEGIPANWTTNSWGNNTATFEYSNSGNSGSKSGKATITSYVDGDAKWYHDQVSVEAGTKYTFRDSYKSTINTEVVVRYTLGGDTYQYEYLGSTPATANWTSAQFDFTVPTGVTHATIFHIIAGVGDLWIDDMFISKTLAHTQPGEGQNQILNPSAENASGNNPANWHANSWGNNTANFEYSLDAQDGSKSMKVSITNYVDGDGKWYHDSVAVREHSIYTLSNYYKSTAPSETVLQYQLNNGTYQYQWLGSNGASSSWVKSEYSFEVPHGINKVTVFHVMAQNGDLWTDNFDLRETTPASPESTIPNADLEHESTTKGLPESWNHNSWGNNTTSFEYLTNYGYNSTHSIKTTVSNYVDGDAKWFHNHIELTPGVNYRVTNYYQSNTDSRIVLNVTMQDGSTQYLELPGAPASAEWTQYSGTFTMPANALSLSIYHILSSVGFLITDKYDITEYNPTPFNRALLTLTFDDGWEENVYTALPMMQEYGFLSNQFYATTFIENSELGITEALNRVRAFEQAGHEMGSHTITHPDLTTLNSADLSHELSYSKSYLQSILEGSIDYFATPYGAYNSAVKAEIMANYTLHRTVDVGYNSKDNFDVTRLKVQNVLNTTTAAEVAGWVEQAQREGTWLILVLHRVAPDAGTYDTTPELFAAQLAAIDASGIEVVTISQALNELVPQL